MRASWFKLVGLTRHANPYSARNTFKIVSYKLNLKTLFKYHIYPYICRLIVAP
jgi:hypothetical protein